MEGIMIFLSMILTFGTFITIVLIVARARQRRLELRAEVQSKLIERFGSAKEMVDFLHSQAGQDFVTGVQTGSRVVAGERVLGGIRRAIILSFAGLGCLALWGVTRDIGWVFPGFILLALGVGYLVAAIVSMRLSSRLGAPSAMERTDVSV
jgi:hypothetical protein